MGSIRVRSETGQLFFDFRYRGQRCREQTTLTDTPANRKRLEKALARIEADIAAETFDYGATFPGSRNAQAASVGTSAPATRQMPPTSAGALAPAAPDATPTLRDFVATWLAEHQIEWRRSHIKVLDSTLEGHLLPAFGSLPVARITKADVLAFRAKLAEKPGRTGAKLSNKRINNILGVLRQIMAEAADRYDFISPCANVKALKIRKSDVQPFTLDEVQRMLAVVRADWRDYFLVRFLTGMRTGEAHGLKWKYVDFDRRLILIRETFVLGEDEYTKTDSSQRDIQMSQPVFEALKRQQERERILSHACGDIALPRDLRALGDLDRLAPAVAVRAAKVVRAVNDKLASTSQHRALQGLIHETLRAQGHEVPLVKPSTRPPRRKLGGRVLSRLP